MSADQLVIFVKAPRLGTVKTRLAASLGARAALAAHCALVETLFTQLAALAGVEVRFTPDEALAEITTWLAPAWTARPQGPGDLGARLQRAFREHFTAGASRVVVIGSDCPDITVGDIQAAWAALSERDVVLGPATDGGYWLVGLRKPQPGLFGGISWSTALVLGQTLRHAQRRGLSVRLLRKLGDVDTAGDWQAFLKRRKNKGRTPNGC